MESIKQNNILIMKNLKRRRDRKGQKLKNKQ